MHVLLNDAFTTPEGWAAFHAAAVVAEVGDLLGITARTKTEAAFLRSLSEGDFVVEASAGRVPRRASICRTSWIVSSTALLA